MKTNLPFEMGRNSFLLNGAHRFLVPVLFFCYFSSTAQLQLLKDINQSEEQAYNEYSSLIHGVGRMYYVVNDTELWKSNGTPESTIRLKTFKSISNLTTAGQTLYFSADDGVTGTELWKSGGTPGTTVRVKDIMVGTASSSPHNLTAVSNIIFFAAYQQSSGIELWKSDGTSAGTVLVKNIVSGNSNPRHMANVNGVLYFSANNTTNGYELWKSDGTTANTVLVKDISVGKASSDPQMTISYQGKAWFSAYDPTYGRELWTSDGTASGTIRIKDIRAGSAGALPKNMIVVNSLLMFTAHDGTHGDELWKTDGTSAGTVLVKDLNPGPIGSNATHELRTPMHDFTNANGILYFVGAKGVDEYIYRSDGTEAGTRIVQKATRVENEVFQPEFTYMNGYVYFFNNVGWSEDQYLLRMPYKGTASQLMNVRTIGKPFGWSESIPVRNEMIHFYNNLYLFGRFSFNDDFYGGYELIKSNGTTEGTVGVHDAFVATQSAEPRDIIRAGNNVYMYVYGPLSYTPPLYRTDGTPAGTVELVEETYPHAWAAVGSRLYIVNSDGGNTWDLSWTEGGTPQNFKSGEIYDGSMPNQLVGIGEDAYYTTEDGSLWRTNGTPGGTVQLKSNAGKIHSVGDRGYVFTGDAGGLELWHIEGTSLELVSNFGGWQNSWAVAHDDNWFYFSFTNGQIFKTNGTPGDLHLLGGSNTSTGDWDKDVMNQMIPLNGTLYFTSINTSGTYSLFKVNGETSIDRITDLPQVVSHAVINNKMILFAPIGEERTEVYTSDGTTEGTQIITSIPSVSYSGWISHAIVGNYLYFNVLRNEHMMRTDGTVCGTYPVDLGTTENFGIVALGNDLVFGGYTIKTGNEPHIYRNPNSIPAPAPCEPEALSASQDMEMSRTEHNDVAYPNPFANTFTFKWDGENDAEVEVSAFTIYGMPVESPKAVKANTVHELGQSWAKGSYILKIRTADKEVTHHVVKQ